MGRVELQRKVESAYDLKQLVEQAQQERADAICVPPMLVPFAAELLGRSKITIVTTAGRDEDILETKLMGIEAAAKAGANEVIVSVAPADLKDERWDVIEKELFQLGQLAGIHDLMLWIGCRFHYLDRTAQVRICEAIPQGFTGLRVRRPSANDIQMANLCEVQGFCACFAWDPKDEPDAEFLSELTGLGATQFTLRNAPEQLKTAGQLHRTEVNL